MKNDITRINALEYAQRMHRKQKAITFAIYNELAKPVYLMRAQTADAITYSV